MSLTQVVRASLLVGGFSGFAACGAGQPPAAPAAPAAPAGNAGVTAAAPGAGESTLTLRWKRSTPQAPGATLATLTRPLRDLRDAPLSFVTRRTAPEAPFRIESRIEVGTERRALPPVSCEEAASCIDREWLEIELVGPGAASRQIERTLYDRSWPGQEEPGAYDRYTLTVVDGAVEPAAVKAKVRASEAEIARRKAEVEALDARPPVKDAAAAEATLAQLDAADPGALIGHLTALEFAAQSDRLTDRVARTAGVVVRRVLPRLILTSTTTTPGGDATRLALDLMLDEVDAVSKAGPEHARQFQFARGLQESLLEGTLMGLGGEAADGVSTARVLLEARRQGIAMLALRREDRQQLDESSLPPSVAGFVSRAFDRGHVVIIPASAVSVAGRDRWGFFDLDPTTGAMIGVMEGGQHQAMMEQSMTAHDVATNPDMAFGIGFISGTINVHFGFAALMLQHGEVTEQLIQELKALMENAACTVCPELNVSGEVSVKFGEDCFKKSLAEVKLKKFEFCDRYADGFKCGVGMLIAALEEESPVEFQAGGEAKIKVGCQELKLGGD